MDRKGVPPRAMGRVRVGQGDPPLGGGMTAGALRTLVQVLRDPDYRIGMYRDADVLLVCDERRPMNYQHPDGDRVVLAVVWGASDYCPEEVV